MAVDRRRKRDPAVSEATNLIVKKCRLGRGSIGADLAPRRCEVAAQFQWLGDNLAAYFLAPIHTSKAILLILAKTRVEAMRDSASVGQGLGNLHRLVQGLDGRLIHQGSLPPPGMVIPAARRSRSHPESPCGTGRAPRCCQSVGCWFATPTKSAIRKPSPVPTSPSSQPTSSPYTSADGRPKSRSPKRTLIWASRHSANRPTKRSLETRRHFSGSTASSRCEPVIFSPT